MKLRLIIILSLLTTLAFSAEYAGSTTQADIIQLKTRNGSRTNSFASASFNFEGDQMHDDNVQMLECKFSQSVSNKFTFFQSNISLYQGLYEAQNSESINGLYDFGGVHSSIMGAVKFRIGRFELCYGVALGCIMESGDFMDFKDEITKNKSEPYQLYSEGFGAWFYHINNDSYFSIQSTSNSNYLQTTSFLFQTEDYGFWLSLGSIESGIYEDEQYNDLYNDPTNYISPCFSFGVTFTI